MYDEWIHETNGRMDKEERKRAAMVWLRKNGSTPATDETLNLRMVDTGEGLLTESNNKS